MKNTCGLYGTTISGLKRSQPATISEKDLSFLNKVIMVAFSMGKHHQINSWHQEGKKKKGLKYLFWDRFPHLAFLNNYSVYTAVVFPSFKAVGSGIKTVIASWKKGW